MKPPKQRKYDKNQNLNNVGHVSFYKILIKDLELRLNVIVTMNKKYHNAPWKRIKRKCRNERVGEGRGGRG